MDNGQENTLTLTLSDVLQISDSSNELRILGDTSDIADIDLVNTIGSVSTNTVVDGSTTFTQYTVDAPVYTLLVDQDITQFVT